MVSAIMDGRNSMPTTLLKSWFRFPTTVCSGLPVDTDVIVKEVEAANKSNSEGAADGDAIGRELLGYSTNPAVLTSPVFLPKCLFVRFAQRGQRDFIHDIH